MIDTHAHLNFATFTDADEVIKRSLENNTQMINVGSQIFTSRRAVELVQKNPEGVYSAVGLHPIHISEEEIEGDEERHKEKYTIDDLPKVLAEIKNLAQQPKVVAIGEVGLDYFHLSSFHDKRDLGGLLVRRENPPTPRRRQSLWRRTTLVRGDSVIKNWQKEYLKEFIKLSIELNKPLILHCRADKDNPELPYLEILDILKSFNHNNVGAKNLSPRGVIHCFGSNLEIAQKFIDQNFLIGFTGIVTFKVRAKDFSPLHEVVKNISLDKILIETDCPYLAPDPFRGKRNEPIYVKYIAQKIAELRGISLAEVEKATYDNAVKLFNI